MAAKARRKTAEQTEPSLPGPGSWDPWQGALEGTVVCPWLSLNTVKNSSFSIILCMLTREVVFSYLMTQREMQRDKE